jgi:uncharacterized OB-fold protein/acyl dehydratase
MTQAGAPRPENAADAVLEEQLRAHTSAPPGTPELARDPVSPALIRHWCDAIGDTNRVYLDAELAARSVHGGIVAPPTMLQAWTLPGLVPAAEKPPPNVLRQISDQLDAAGFTGVVATDCEQEYVRYLRPGDRPSLTTTIDEVSEPKQTALGFGYFITSGMTFRDQADEVVGRMRFRILKFRPSAGAAAAASAPAPSWPRPAINPDNAFFWEGVEREELLIQRCSGCRKLRHPPRPMCPDCQSLDWETVKAGGRGTLHSFVVPHHPQIPPFEYPFVVALVQLEEGTRFISNLTGVDPAEVHIGMPVELYFTEVEEGLTLPRFRPAGSGRSDESQPGSGPTEDAPTEAETLQPRDTTLRYDEVRVGDEIPPLPILITPTLIVSTAIASRDYQDVHHDRGAAEAAGSKDIFMNILSTGGFIGRYVTDWAGPEAILKKMSIRLGAPNYPDDTMRITGKVTGAEERDGEGWIELEVKARNAYGDHATGSVAVVLPRRG